MRNPVAQPHLTPTGYTIRVIPMIEEYVEAARDKARATGVPHYLMLNRPANGAWPVNERVLPDSMHASLGGALALGPTFIHISPHGLAADDHNYPWVWAVGNHFYTGTVAEAERFCRRYKVDPEDVVPVPSEDIHGTCVYVPGRHVETNPRDWRMVQTKRFPT